MTEGAADQTCVSDLLIHRKVLQKVRSDLVELSYQSEQEKVVEKLWFVINAIDKAVGFAFLTDPRTR